MKTSAIASPANITQNLAANKSEGANADMPFSQVLSRETSKANVRETSPAPQSQAAPNAPAKTKAADGGNAKEVNESEDDGTAAHDAASAEMLALVANLAQANAAQGDPRNIQADTEGAAVAADALAAAGTGESVLTRGTDTDLLGKQPQDGIIGQGMATRTLLPAQATATGFQGEALAAQLAGQAVLPADKQPAAFAIELPAKAQSLIGAQDKTLLASTKEIASVNLNATAAAANSDSAGTIEQSESRALPELSTAGKKVETPANQQLPELTALKAHEAPAPAAPGLEQVQQAGLAARQTMAANPAEKLTPQVGTPGWDQALGQKVVWMVAGGQQSASLTLNPPDLGPLQVVLNVSNSQATASFTAAQPEVRQALEAALPRLREMLADSGIQLGQTSVGSGAPNQFSAPNEQSAHGARHFAQNPTTAETLMPTTRAKVQSVGQGLIDTFA